MLNISGLNNFYYIRNFTDIIDKGRKGKEYYDNFFTKEKCLKKLDDIMGL